jgi:hypothetical protein
VDGGLMVSVHLSLKESFLLLLGWHTLFVSYTQQLCKNEPILLANLRGKAHEPPSAVAPPPVACKHAPSATLDYETLWSVVFHIPVLPKMYVMWVIWGSRSRKKRDISRKYHAS